MDLFQSIGYEVISRSASQAVGGCWIEFAVAQPTSCQQYTQVNLICHCWLYSSEISPNQSLIHFQVSSITTQMSFTPFSLIEFDWLIPLLFCQLDRKKIIWNIHLQIAFQVSFSSTWVSMIISHPPFCWAFSLLCTSGIEKVSMSKNKQASKKNRKMKKM